MSPRFLARTGLVVAGAMFLGACASTTEIDPADLPPEATVDDGIDYYSTDLTASDPSAQELFNYNNNQWVIDENGNRVYLLRQLRSGRMTSYYVGDIRFLYAYSNAGGPVGTAFGETPVYVSQGGTPSQSPTIRGMRDDTYFQTRGGRIIYLPNAPRPPDNQNDTSDRPPGNSSVPAATSASPSPMPATAPARPATPAPRVTAPKRTTKPRARPADDVRRPDR